MIEPKKFVRKVWQSLPREPQKPETGKWAMGQGVVWLRQPEMWCPVCRVSWVNPWTWLVNERRGRVDAVWGEDGKKKYLGDVHPHVMGSGEICTGGALVIEALTSGFNIQSCFCGGENFPDVMSELGHRGCEQVVEDEEGDWSYCELCDETYDMGEVAYYESAHRYLCDGCWHDQSVQCDGCYHRFYYPDNGRIDPPLTQVRGGEEFCEDCLQDCTYCDSCDEWKLPHEIEDGRCFDCVPEDTGEQLELPLKAGEAKDGTEN